MIKVSLKEVTTPGWRVNISSRENCKGIQLALPTEGKLLLVGHMDRYPEKEIR